MNIDKVWYEKPNFANYRRKDSVNRENLTRNLLLANFCLFHPPKPKGHRWTTYFESGGTSPPQGGKGTKNQNHFLVEVAAFA